MEAGGGSRGESDRAVRTARRNPIGDPKRLAQIGGTPAPHVGPWSEVFIHVYNTPCQNSQSLPSSSPTVHHVNTWHQSHRQLMSYNAYLPQGPRVFRHSRPATAPNSSIQYVFRRLSPPALFCIFSLTSRPSRSPFSTRAPSWQIIPS